MSDESILFSNEVNHKQPTSRPSANVLLDVHQLAARIGCTDRHISNLVKREKIPAIKVGRLTRFNWLAVLQALEEPEVTA